MKYVTHKPFAATKSIKKINILSPKNGPHVFNTEHGETKIKIRILIVGIEENIIKNQCHGSPRLYFVWKRGVLFKVGNKKQRFSGH